MVETKRKIDWLIVALYFILVILGWLNLYATNYTPEHFLLFKSNSGKQLIWIAISIIMAIFILMLDPHVLSTFAYGIYGLIILFLLIVLFYGTIVHGSKSWIEIGGARIQPSEFAKFATALALARYLSNNTFKWQLSNLKYIIISIGIVLLPTILIILQPDLGTAIVFSAFIFVFYREGMQGFWLIFLFIVVLSTLLALLTNILWLLITYLIISALIVWLFYGYKKALQAIGIFLIVFTVNYIIALIIKQINLVFLIVISLLISSIFYIIDIYKRNLKNAHLILLILYTTIFINVSTNFIYNKVLKEHQRQRIDLVLNKINDIRGVGYNLYQSKIAISSGGILGKGWLKGTITKYDFVPEEDTDFIFCTLGEEWGFVGTLIIFALFFILIVRIIYIAEQQHSTFTRVYAYSVAAIIFFHVSINIGMTVGVFPVIGIPLPFFSYGGSAMLGFTILIFILLNLDRKREFLI